MSDETSIKINRTAAATAARMKASDEKAAAKLRARGWVCLAPGVPLELESVRTQLERMAGA